MSSLRPETSIQSTFTITEEIESWDFEPPDGATLVPYTNIGKISKGRQIFH